MLLIASRCYLINPVVDARLLLRPWGGGSGTGGTTTDGTATAATVRRKVGVHTSLDNRHSFQYPHSLPPLNYDDSHVSLQEQQIAEIVEAVGIIHAVQYLHGLDEALQTVPVGGSDRRAMFQVW